MRLAARLRNLRGMIRKLLDATQAATKHKKLPKGVIAVAPPSFRRERALIKRGVWPVAGCDEAGRKCWLGGASPTDLGDITLDVSKLAESLTRHREKIARARLWIDPRLKLKGALTAEAGHWREGV